MHKHVYNMFQYKPLGVNTCSALFDITIFGGGSDERIQTIEKILRIGTVYIGIFYPWYGFRWKKITVRKAHNGSW